MCTIKWLMYLPCGEVVLVSTEPHCPISAFSWWLMLLSVQMKKDSSLASSSSLSNRR